MLVGVPREEPDDGLEGKIGINRPPIRVVDQVNSENTVGRGTSVSFLVFFISTDGTRLSSMAIPKVSFLKIFYGWG